MDVVSMDVEPHPDVVSLDMKRISIFMVILSPGNINNMSTHGTLMSQILGGRMLFFALLMVIDIGTKGISP
eukprot:gnl/Chilomastix_caulleri/5402.p1 GENE.gnl/Chilomastix_caulleri/5402~~gnl/Chilomastix_caulleri/5402.p1  ORF type:complete len:71 (-),score=8.35 gnl/Chilomastix_caulleri/5402:136-348(-)